MVSEILTAYGSTVSKSVTDLCNAINKGAKGPYNSTSSSICPFAGQQRPVRMELFG